MLRAAGSAVAGTEASAEGGFRLLLSLFLLKSMLKSKSETPLRWRASGAILRGAGFAINFD